MEVESWRRFDIGKERREEKREDDIEEKGRRERSEKRKEGGGGERYGEKRQSALDARSRLRLSVLAMGGFEGGGGGNYIDDPPSFLRRDTQSVVSSPIQPRD